MQTFEQTSRKIPTANGVEPLILNGSQEEFYRFYDVYAAPLYGAILNMVKSKNKAGKILIQTFNLANKEIYSYEKARVSHFIWLLRMAVQFVVSQKKQVDVSMTRSNMISVFTDEKRDTIG